MGPSPFHTCLLISRSARWLNEDEDENGDEDQETSDTEDLDDSMYNSKWKNLKKIDTISRNKLNKDDEGMIQYYEELPSDEDFLEDLGPRKVYTHAKFHLCSPCPFCKQVICEGTTLSTFINKRIDYRGESLFDAEQSFVNAYLFVKDYDEFQASRFTNPEAEIDSAKVPKCVMDAFEEYISTRDTTFNKCLIAGKKSK